MIGHAVLGPSKANQWLHCTPSVMLESEFPDLGSDYAREGTVAHELAALKVEKHFTPMKLSTYNARLKEIKKSKFYDAEMERHTDSYLQFIKELAYSFPTAPVIRVETKVDLSKYIPEGFGTADCILISGNTLYVIDSVTKTARVMVVEVRRQFREIKGLIEGEVLPDYESCISIASRGALREMRAPALLAVVVPVISGLIFGPIFVAGLLLGSTLSAVMLALFTGNIGGAWDNAKKYIEVGGVKGVDRDSPEHDAAIVGDTVGDPLKDTVGPSLDILIKIMSVVSLVMGSVFARFNLLDWIRSLFG
jgi:hypothetical protein